MKSRLINSNKSPFQSGRGIGAVDKVDSPHGGTPNGFPREPPPASAAPIKVYFVRETLTKYEFKFFDMLNPPSKAEEGFSCCIL